MFAVSMRGSDLAKLIGPLVGASVRPRLRLLAIGTTSDIALRYDEINDWAAMAELIVQHSDHLQMYDGQEMFTLEITT